MLGKIAQKRLLLTTVSLVSFFIALMCAEIGLRIFLPQPVDYFYFEKTPKPNSSFRRWGIPININNAGFRDIDHIFHKDADTFRIAVVGDSITYGTGVMFEDIYHQQLKKILQSRIKSSKKIEILAFNQGATNTEWALSTYLSTISKYSPDYIILGFCLNDFENYDIKEDVRLETTLSRTALDLVAEFHQQARIKSHLYFLVFERARRLVYQYIIDRKVRTIDSWIPMMPQHLSNKELFALQVESTARLLKRFQDAVIKNGSKFKVLIFPFEMQIGESEAKLYASEYDAPGILDAPQGIAQKLFTAKLAELQIPFVDLLPAFKRFRIEHADTPLFFRELGGMLDWAHPNAQGHRLIANVVADAMMIEEHSDNERRFTAILKESGSPRTSEP